jgi:elongation factor P
MDANMIEGSEKQLDLLHDGMVVSVQILEPDQALTYRLPKYHTYTVDRDEPGAAQAAKGVSYKTAYIADGKVRIVVPEFVQVGDRVVVDLEECSYVSRESKA